MMSETYDIVYDSMMENIPSMTPELATLTIINMSLQAMTKALCEMGMEGHTVDMMSLVEGLMETVIWLQAKQESFDLTNIGTNIISEWEKNL